MGQLPEPDYSVAFDQPAGESRSAEEWARAVWEGAPRGVRGFLRAGWRAGLGLRLGPRTGPDHVLGWQVVSRSPTKVLLSSRSPLMTAHNVVETADGQVRWTTRVWFTRRAGRALWALAAPVHRRAIPYLLARAAGDNDVQHRVVTTFQRRLGNPVLRRLPVQTLLETTGRVSGLPRVTPVGGRRVGQQFWIVSEFGEKSQYVRNIRADPHVRLRLRGRWHTGTAHPLPDDDPRARLRTLPLFNSMGVRALGTDLLTVRVDLT